MVPVAEPVRGGSLDALRLLINVRSDDDYALIVSWSLAGLRERYTQSHRRAWRGQDNVR